MNHNPYLYDALTKILKGMGRDKLFESCLSLINNTPDEDLEAVFEADLIELGYLNDDDEEY